MAFVVEDGTGKVDANAYADVAFADGYFTERGMIAWAGTDAAKQAVLIRATDYIEGRFGLRFIGSKATDTQALAWPRESADPYAEGEVPVKLQRACCEYALRALTAELAPDLKVDASGVTMVTTFKKVGPLETHQAAVTKGLGSEPLLFRPYPAADMLLRGLVYSASPVIR